MKYDFVSHVKNPVSLNIAGFEELGFGESIRLFFEEFFTETDKKLANFQTSLHTINYQPVEKYLVNNNILFIDNAGKKIPVPTYYQSGEGEMNYYVDNVAASITVVEMFKTEISRFYDWIKGIIKKGRADNTYKWTITDFDAQAGKVAAFIKDLYEGPKNEKLGVVYVNFGEAFGMMQRYSSAVSSIKARDAEVMSRELKNVYEIGSLLVDKIKNNDIVVAKSTLEDIKNKVNMFNELVNIVGASLGLINELTAVFNSQLEVFKTHIVTGKQIGRAHV